MLNLSLMYKKGEGTDKNIDLRKKLSVLDNKILFNAPKNL